MNELEKKMEDRKKDSQQSILESRSDGSRSRGRPRLRWCDGCSCEPEEDRSGLLEVRCHRPCAKWRKIVDAAKSLHRSNLKIIPTLSENLI